MKPAADTTRALTAHQIAMLRAVQHERPLCNPTEGSHPGDLALLVSIALIDASAERLRITSHGAAYLERIREEGPF